MDSPMPPNSSRADLKGIEDEIIALTRTVEQAVGQMKKLFEDANCFCKIKPFSNLSAAHKQGYTKWTKIRNNTVKKLKGLRAEGSILAYERILARERLRNPQASGTQQDASSYKRERVPRSMPQRPPSITRITGRSLIASGRHQRPIIEPRKSQYLSANIKGRHILPGKGLLANWEAFQMNEGHEDPFGCIVSDSSDRENDEDMEELLWESKRKKAAHGIRGRVAIEHFTSLHDSDTINDFKRSQIVKRVQAKKDATDRLKSAPPLNPYPPRRQSTFNQLRQNVPQGQTIPVSTINPHY